MKWNWQLPEWPNFTFDQRFITSMEEQFLQGAGGVFAILKHLDEAEKIQFIVEILSLEGLESSKIEGEVLERESLQSSIKRHFGINTNSRIGRPKEKGIADLMCSVFDKYDKPLSHEMLHKWHAMVLGDGGKYRTHKEPMQIISSRYDRPRVHFEAPPSKAVMKEMSVFIQWFNSNKEKSSILVRAALAHVYFESIHPFEDGNGRIGRALVEKALSDRLGHPTLIAVSNIIDQRKKEYYAALGKCNRTLEVSSWVHFFSKTILDAQCYSMRLVNFLICKSKMMHSLKGKMNDRQEKALLRMFAEGLEGFSGGLSAENYISITKASKATATRDLVDLVKKGVLTKSGQLRHTRYWLNLDEGRL